LKLWEYVGGIARNKGLIAQAVGGVEDHVHALLTLPATITIAQAANAIKGGSSYWLSKSFSELSEFSWQEGYAAISVSPSDLDSVKRYINDQAKHHKRFSYQDEIGLIFGRNVDGA